MRNLSNYLFFIFFIVSSCKNVKIENKKSYKKINTKKLLIERGFYCYNTDIYYIKKSKKELNGKYKLKSSHETIYANFKNGLFDGKVIKIQKNQVSISDYTKGLRNGKNQESFKYRKNYATNTKSKFINGKKNGIELYYENDTLERKSIFVDNTKHGKEYIFNTNKDTIDIIDYNFQSYSYIPSSVTEILDKDQLNLIKNSFKGILKFKGTKNSSYYEGFYFSLYPPAFSVGDCFETYLLINVSSKDDIFDKKYILFVNKLETYIGEIN